MNDAPALDVSNLSVAVRRPPRWVPAVADIDLNIAPQQSLGIVGETGAGKTLLARAIAGLLPNGARITSGTVTLAGAPPRSADDLPAARQTLGRTVSMIFQNPAAMFDPMMKIGSQLIEAVTVHKLLPRDVARERAISLLASIGFDDAPAIMSLYPHELSGGMAQRAAIAMALMPQPRLVIADEPTSALDANLRLEVLRLLRDRALSQGAALMLVSHDLAAVSQFCDTVVVMYAGHIAERGPARSVAEGARHPYSARLFEASPSIAASPLEPLPTIPGTPPAPGNWPAGCVFQPRCPLAFKACEARPQLSATSEGDVACHLVAADAGREPRVATAPER